MKPQLLLCTDLDRTLIPNGPQPESPIARDLFQQFIQHAHVELVYVTGRDRVLVEQAILQYQLPTPAFVIANVGATIYQLNVNRWHCLQQWVDAIAPDWGTQSHADLVLLFSDIKNLQLQERSKQSIFKLSYYAPLTDDIDHIVAEMQSRLDDKPVNASIITSVDESAQKRLLDILPRGASKRHAVEFMMRHLGYNLESTVFAGDSGNDLDVFSSPILSILVANASQEIRELAQRQAPIRGQHHTLYVATGGYRNMNGNYSAGIIEGIVHYLPWTEKYF